MMIFRMRVPYIVLAFGLFVILSICGLLVLLSAAAEENSTQAQSIRREVEKETMEEAMNAFKAGDYKKAKIEFEMLSESAQVPEIGRRALFGLASVKLVLANSSEEYEDAISIWKKWNGQVNYSNECEDTQMITPFLLRLQTSIKAAGGGLSGSKGRRSGKGIDFKGILQNKEKEMQVLRAKLELREREVHRLRHQLESLEEIHRKYEEKKQEATP